MASRHRNRIVTPRKANRSSIERRIVEGLENRLLLTVSPSVQNVTPAANATGIALNAPITVNVNLPNGGLNPNTVIGANVFLYPASNPYNDGDVPAVVNTTGGGDAIILTPSVNLLPSTKYTFSISAAVQDINGDAFTTFSESFTTGSMAPTIDQNIAFQKIALPTTDGTPFTDMQIGPDGELYASTEDGRIFRYVINANGTLGKPQIITTLQTYEGGQRLITGFAFDPASTPNDPILWVSNTFYALSGATNGPNFTSKLTVMSGENLTNVTDAIVDLPRSISDHVNDQPIFEPGTENLFFCQAGQNAYGAPDTTWGNRAETLLSAAILEVNTTALNLSGPALNVLTPDVGGTYNPYASGAPLTIYATGIRNAFSLYFDSTGQLWAVLNGSSSGGNAPAFTAGASGQINGNRIDTGQPYAGPNVPGLTNVAQTEDDTLDKIVPGGYYGHPDPARGEYVLDDGNPTTGGVPGLTFTAYPSGTNPDPNYRVSDIFIMGQHLSPDAIFPYTAPTGAADPFGAALDNEFLITEYSAGDDIAAITRTAGDSVQTDANDNVVADRSISGFNDFDNPLALLENPTNGYLYVSELGGDKITLLKPASVSPQISVTTSAVNNAVAFNTIASGFSGAGPSRTETATLTNTGADPLTFGSGAFSIVNDPTTTAAASNFTITNAGSLPGSLAAGASFTVNLQYSATAVGLQSALLQIQSNDPVNPTFDVNLHGIGTPGQFGTLEPSLVQVLLAQNIPTIVGAGPNDVNVNTQKYPIDPDPSSQEVPMQRLEEATPGPITITPLAGFSSATQPVSQIGYYTPGDPSDATELFYINKADAQTVDPTGQGATSFDPGINTPFGLYGEFPGTSTPNGSIDIHYSEDALNTLDPTNERKIRFFPMETANGTVVPNSYVFAIEDYDDPTQYNSFINFVGIISNVQAAPNATAGSTPSSPTGDNPPVMGVVLNQTSPAATNLVFNTIQNTNPVLPDVVDNSNTITINNTGDQPLVINSLTLANTTAGSSVPASSVWQLVDPPVAGTAIAGGSSITVTVKFVASTDPPHTTNETNDTATTNDISVTAAGGVWDGTLTIASNDSVNPTHIVNLAGYWQDQTEHENEPGLATITNLFGYVTSDPGSTSTNGTEYPNNGSSVVLYGDEVDPSTDQGLFVAAQANVPVGLTEIASYHQQLLTVTATVGSTTFTVGSASESGTTVTITTAGTSGFKAGQQVTVAGVAVAGYNGTFTIASITSPTMFTYTSASSGLATSPTGPTQAQAGWYPVGGGTTYLYKDQPGNGQTVFPQLAKDAFSSVETTFTPSGAFGLNLDGEKSQDALNTTDINTYMRSGHSILVFPMVDSSGNVVPNTWIIGMDYQDGVFDNNDYQDLVMVLSNATPEGMPGTPSDLQATQGASGVNLEWGPSYAAASYNVLASVNGGAFTQINTSPITTSSYTDSTSSVGNIQYEVVAVNSSSVKSLAARASIDLAGPNNGASLVAPAAPTITEANGSSSSGTQVLLTWTAPTGATAYNVQRESPGQTSFTTIAPGLTTPTYIDTTVTDGLTYQYQVQAANAAGLSPFSAPPVSVTVTQSLSAPAAPTITQLDGSSGTQVVMTWTASAGATSYIVQREEAGASSFTIVDPDATGTSFTDTGVQSNTTYSYEVQAQNSSGSSAFSAPMSVMVGPGAPAAPTNVQFSTTASDSVVLTWDATPDATTYDVQREDLGGSSYSDIVSGLTSPTYTDTTVVAGKSYNYEIIAVNAAGPSPASSAVTVAVPPPVATLSVTVGKSNSSFVKFTTPTGAVVTIKLLGAGTATVNFDADSISQSASGKGVIVSGTNVSIASIITAGTTAGSSLSVTTRHGSNAVNIGAITVGASLNSITAPTAALIGALTVTGSLNRITLGSVVAATMTIGGKLGSFHANSVTGATLTAGGVIGSIVASDWASNHAITAASINSINLKGNAQIDVTAGVLRSLHVQGELHDSAITLSAGGTQDLASLSAFSIDDSVLNTTGNIGTVSASMLVNSQIYAGTGATGAMAFPPVSSSFAAAATIANINLRKIKGELSDTNSSIAASQIGQLNLGNVQFSNGGIHFGVQATLIKSLTAATTSVKPFTFHKLTSDAIVSADFSAKKITPQDFSVEIV